MQPAQSSRPSTTPVRMAARFASSRVFQGAFLTIGQFVAFTAVTFWLLPLTVRRYRRETLQMMTNLAWGRGSILVDGGIISVLIIMGIAIGGSVAVEAFATLNLIGLGALSGLVGGLANVREMAPLVAGIAFASQAGCRMTAEIGSMRIAEEIDAVEALGLRPIPFVVGTRVLGALMCIVPGLPDHPGNQLLRNEHGHPGISRPARRHLSTLLRPIPADDRHRLLADQGNDLLPRRYSDSLLLRLFHVRRPRRRGPSVRPRRARQLRRHHGPRFRPDDTVVGPYTRVRVQGLGGECYS